MDRNNIFKLIHLDDHSATPKYQQLANSIINAIERGQIGKDSMMPSINELSFEFQISRDTAEKGYKHLKSIGVLGSVPGKGFYIKNAEVKQKLKIFLLFNKLSAHKKIIYDSIVSSLAGLASIDFYIYNNDFALFSNLLQSKQDQYTHYVIIPHVIAGGEDASEVINKIDKTTLILLDKLVPGVDGKYGAVYDNFEKDITGAFK